MTFSEAHQAWYAGDGRWYKAVGSGSTWHVQWYDGVPVGDSFKNLKGKDFNHTYSTWQEANEVAGHTAKNWYENASKEGRASHT